MTLTRLTLKRIGDFKVEKDDYYNDILVAWYEIPELRGGYSMITYHATRFVYANLKMFKYVPENYMDHWIFIPDAQTNAFEFIHSFGNKYGLDIDYHLFEEYNGSEKNTPYCMKVTCKPEDLDNITRFINDLNSKFEEFQRVYYEKEQKKCDEREQKIREWETSDTYQKIKLCNSRFPEEIK